MKIAQIDIWNVTIPFSSSIGHHLKTRSATQSIVLAVTTSDGRVGYGEGTPRSYVTGEESRDIIAQFSQAMNRNGLLSIQCLDDIRVLSRWLLAYHRMPAMVTALELALLDLYGQYRECPVAGLFDERPKEKPVYSGILPFVSATRRKEWLRLIKSLELPAIKVKVGRPDDLEVLRETRQLLGPEVDIRVDANRSWSFERARKMCHKMVEYGVSSVEEPLAEAEPEQLEKLAYQIPIPLMADESLTSLEDARRLADRIPPDRLKLNLKLSKLGGLFATSEIYDWAAEKNIRCQLGCHVGETAILTAAGRMFARCHRLEHLEGTYGSFFMEEDLVIEPLAFAKKGVAPVLGQPGLGIQIEADQIKKYGTHAERIRLRGRPVHY